MSNEAKITCTDVSVFYGEKEAIKSVSMDVPDNAVTAFIGPSGCGKSTLLRAFNRMHDDVEVARVTGRITLDGRDLNGANVDPVDVRKRVGMVFQRSTPFAKSIFDNVAFGLRIAGESKRSVLADRVERCLKAAALWDEVSDRLDAPATGLSGGQQQRLCIARALAIEPEVLLMDEPASALDPIATGAIEELILELKKDYCIVLVTHSMQQARRVADHTAFFYLGELIEYRGTSELFEHPRESKTADYILGRFG